MGVSVQGRRLHYSRALAPDEAAKTSDERKEALKKRQITRANKELIWEGYIDPSSEQWALMSKSEKRQREEAKDKVDVLFTTYQMGEEGLDLPFLDTLVMVTPRKSLDQIIGRILRKKEGKQSPLIVDVVDSVSIFFGMARGRMRYYREKQYKIIKQNNVTLFKVRLQSSNRILILE